MRRFSATLPILLVMLLVFASAAVGQPAPRVARVGMLCSVSCTVDGYDTLSDELRKLGWIEGTNLVIERKGAATGLRAFAKDIRATPTRAQEIGEKLQQQQRGQDVDRERG